MLVDTELLRAITGSDCTDGQPEYTNRRRGMTATPRRSETGLGVNPLAILHALVTRTRDSKIVRVLGSITTLARKLPVTSML